MKLTEENYYSREANELYMSVSQYKEFVGTYGREACEASALAKLRGEWEEETNIAMLVGSYVDHYFENTLDAFKDEHPEILKKDGSLKADYVKADQLIKRAESDKLFMKYLSGDKQVIMTGVLGDTQWKIKMDSYIQDKAIVDLKVMASIRELKWAGGVREYLDFIRYWGYDTQAAVYQEIVYQNTGKRLPFFIAAISKEKEPDLEIIHITDVYLDDALDRVVTNLPRIIDIKSGAQAPERCERCDYCRHTKVLKKPIGIKDLMGERA